MNTFFSLERFTRLSVPLRLFRVLFWTLFVGVLGAGAAGQAQTSTQSTEYPPEYYWQQPITGFRNTNDAVQIVYAKYAYGNMGRTTSTDPDSLQFQKNITLLRNGIQLSPAEAQLDLQPVTSKDPASTSTTQYYDAWNPYAVLAPTSSNIRTASFGSYVSFDVANANRGDLNYFGPYYLNASRNVWSITFTLAKPDTSSAVYTIRMRDKYGKVLDSNVVQVGVIPQGSAATFAVVKQPANASVSSGSLMAFSVDPQNHVLGLLNTPFGVTSDANGNVFIADTLNNAIRKISVGGRMTTLAGLDGQSLDFVNGTNAMILGGTLLNGTRQLTAGTTTTVINRDRAPQAGFRDGTSDQRTGDGTTNPNTYRYDTTIVTGVSNATGAGPTSSEPLFNNPQGIAVADNGMLFVVDTNNNAIRSITVNTGTGTGTAIVSTVLGGPAASNFNKPRAIALTGSLANYDDANPPSLWVVDSNNYRIQKITLGSDGAMTDFEYIAGIGTTPGWGGTGTNVTQNFLSPSGLVVSADELTIYIADTANHVIRRLQRADKGIAVWNAVTLAGAVGFKGNVNERGTEARLSFPTGLALDETNGFLYFTEFGNHGVRRLILPGGNSAQPYVQGGTLGAGLRYELQVEAIAGGGRPLPNPIDGATGEGTGSNAGFNYPAGITFNKLDGSLILADSNNHVIRKITYLTNLANNLDPDGSYNQLNTQSKTVEKVVVDRLGSVFSNGTVQAMDDKLVGNSVTLTGVATYAGNHDYTELTEYPNYEWLFWGEPIGYLLDYGTNASEYTGDGTTDLEIQSANNYNVGPYQVNITNYWGVGNFSNQVSGYVALGEQPKFLAPGYALFDSVGKRILNFGTLAGGSYTTVSGTQTAVGTQLSTYPDRTAKPLQLGDRVSLNASILPGDEVTYQWQVTAESLKAVGGYGGGLGSPVEDYPWVNLVDAQTDVQTAGVSLQGHVFSGSLVSAGSLCVRDLLGTKGDLGISRLSGTTTATLNIEHFQQSFYGKVPPQLRFRVKSYKKGTPQVDVGASATSLDTKNVVLVNPDTYTETLVPTATLNTGTVNDEDRTNGLLLSPNYPPVVSDTQLLVNGNLASAATGVAATYVATGTVTVLKLSGTVSAAPTATYQWKYIDPVTSVVSDVPQATGAITSLSAGTVTLSGSLSTTITGSLSSGVLLPGIYYVTITNGVTNTNGLVTPLESQRVKLQAFPPNYNDALALTASSSGSNVSEQPLIVSMGAFNAVEQILWAEFLSTPGTQPKFEWTFVSNLSGSSSLLQSGGTYASISASPIKIESGSLSSNRYRTTFTGSLATTAAGTYQLVASIITANGTLTAPVQWPVAIEFSPRYVAASRFADLDGVRQVTGDSGDVPPLTALGGSIVFGGSFTCPMGVTTHATLKKGSSVVRTWDLPSATANVISVGTVLSSIKTQDLGAYTLQVYFDSNTSGKPLVFSDTVSWSLKKSVEPYKPNILRDGFSLNATTDVSKTINSATSLAGNISVETDHTEGGSSTSLNYTSTEILKKYVTVGQSIVLEFALDADPAPNVYKWSYSSEVKALVGGTSGYQQSGTIVSGTAFSKAIFQKPSLSETVLLSGGTTATLSIKVPSTASAGTHGFYQLFAANTQGSVTSPIVQLIVNPVPAPVVTGTFGGTIVHGGTAVLNVSSLQAGSYSYQWKKNGIDLVEGGTQSTLIISNALTAQAGAYSVVVTDNLTQTKRQSAQSFSVAVTGSDTSGDARQITFKNTTKLRMFLCSASLSRADLEGDVYASAVPGTKVTLSSVVPTNQMIQCWRMYKTSEYSDDSLTSKAVIILPGNITYFLMPSYDVTLEAVLSRPYSSTYAGFLTLQKPWFSDYNYEWTSRSDIPSEVESQIEPFEPNKLRGYLSCALTSTGLISGKITLEDKLYTFVSTLGADMTASFQIASKLPNGNPWKMTGKIAFDTTPENESLGFQDNVMHVILTDALLKTPPLLNSGQTLYCRALGNGGPAQKVSVSNLATGVVGSYKSVGGALGTLMSGITVQGAISNVQTSGGAAIGGGTTVPAGGIYTGGITTGGVTTGVSGRGGTYISATNSYTGGTYTGGTTTGGVTTGGTYVVGGTSYIGGSYVGGTGTGGTTTGGILTGGTFQNAIYVGGTVNGGVTSGNTITGGSYSGAGAGTSTSSSSSGTTGTAYTAGIFRPNSSGVTSAASFGQGGVFTISVGGSTGVVIVTGIYGNGVQFSYSGPLLQANYDAPEDTAIYSPTTLASDLSVRALEVLTEAILGDSASVIFPIFVKGEKPTEPVFGVCIFGDSAGANTNTLYGCLGTLNAGVTSTNTSEFTENYVGGYVFDPTLAPFTSVATGVTATVFTSETYPFSKPLAKWTNGVSQLASTLGTGALPFSNGSKTFGWTPQSASSSNTGNFTLTYLEKTSAYVNNTTVPKQYPNFAAWYDVTQSPNAVIFGGKDALQCGIAGVMLCGAAPGDVPLTFSVSPFNEGRTFTAKLPYGIGFFLRGLSTGAKQYAGNMPQTLRDTLGNGSVEAITLKASTTTTHRTEAVTIVIGDPY